MKIYEPIIVGLLIAVALCHGVKDVAEQKLKETIKAASNDRIQRAINKLPLDEGHGEFIVNTNSLAWDWKDLTYTGSVTFTHSISQIGEVVFEMTNKTPSTNKDAYGYSEMDYTATNLVMTTPYRPVVGMTNGESGKAAYVITFEEVK